MRDPLGLIDEPTQTDAAPTPAETGGEIGYDPEELDRFYNTPVTVTDPLGALQTPEEEAVWAKKRQDRAIAENPPLEEERDEWAALDAKDKAAKEKEATGWQEEPETLKEVARNVTGDILGVLAKLGAGAIKGITLGAVDPEKGTINVPFTSKKMADYAPPLDASLKEFGVSKEITKNPYLAPIGEFGGIAVPWTATTKALSWALKATKEAEAARAGVKAGTALGEAKQAGALGAAGEDAAAQMWSRQYAGTAERIGIQAATGGIVGAAHVREEGDSLIMNALVGAVSGATLAGAIEIAHRIASVAGLTKMGAYLNLKAEMSEMFYSETGKMTRQEADVLADWLIRKAEQQAAAGGKPLDAWGYRGLQKRTEQGRAYFRSRSGVRKPGSGETVDAEYADQPRPDAPDFAPAGEGSPGPKRDIRGMVPQEGPTLPPGQGFDLVGRPYGAKHPVMDAAYASDKPGPPHFSGVPYQERGIPIDVMRARELPPPEDLDQAQRQLPMGTRDFTLKGPSYEGNRPPMMTPMYDLRHEPGREGDWYDGFIMTGEPRGEGPPPVIPLPAPASRGLLPPPTGQAPPPSPPLPEDLAAPKDEVVPPKSSPSAPKNDLRGKPYDPTLDPTRPEIEKLQKGRLDRIKELHSALSKESGKGRSPDARRRAIDGEIRVLQGEYARLYQRMEQAGADPMVIDKLRSRVEGRPESGVSIDRNAPSPASKMPPLPEDLEMSPLIHFRSGASSISDLKGYAANQTPLGVDASKISKNAWEVLIKNVRKGGMVFIDSGAFGAYTGGIKAYQTWHAKNVWGRINQSIPEDVRSGPLAQKIYLVAPDVVGDQAKTLDELKNYYSTMVYYWLWREPDGFKVIMPIQKGALPPSEYWTEVLTRINTRYEFSGRKLGPRDEIVGSQNLIPGIPSVVESFTIDDLRELLSKHSFSRIHFLGIGPESKKGFDEMVEVARLHNPNIVITSDSNRLRAQLKEITKVKDKIQESISHEIETDLALRLTDDQIRAICKECDVPVEDMRLWLEQGSIPEEYAGDDRIWAAIRKRADREAGGPARSEAIAKIESAKYIISSKNMKKGYWKVVNSETGETASSGIESKAGAQAAADSLNLNWENRQPLASDQRAAVIAASEGQPLAKESLPFQGRQPHELSIEEWWDEAYLRKPYAQVKDEEIPSVLESILPGDMLQKGDHRLLSLSQQREMVESIRQDSIDMQVEGKGKVYVGKSKRATSWSHYKIINKALKDGKQVPYAALKHYPDLDKEARRLGLLVADNKYDFKGTAEAVEYGIDHDEELSAMRAAHDNYKKLAAEAKAAGNQKEYERLVSFTISTLQEAIEAAQGIFGSNPEMLFAKRPELLKKIQKKRQEAVVEKERTALYENWSDMLRIQDGQAQGDLYPLILQHIKLFRAASPKGRADFKIMVSNGRFKWPADLMRRAKAELGAEADEPIDSAPPPSSLVPKALAREGSPYENDNLEDLLNASIDEQQNRWDNLLALADAYADALKRKPPAGRKDTKRAEKLKDEALALMRIYEDSYGEIENAGGDSEGIRSEVEGIDVPSNDFLEELRADMPRAGEEQEYVARPIHELTLSEYLDSRELKEQLSITADRPLTNAEFELGAALHMGAVSRILKEGGALHGKVLADYPDLGPHKTMTKGNMDKAKTAEGTEVNVQYAIMKLSDLTASHDGNLVENPAYPQRFQNRNRSKEASKVQLAEYTGPAFEPRYYGPNFSTVHGAPIVLPTGIVISGNMRVMTLQNISPERMAKYQEFMRGVAPTVGIKAEWLPENGILVRVIDPAEVRDLRRFAEESNKDVIAGMSAADLAKQDAGRITKEMLDVWQTGSSGNINAATNRAFIQRFATQVLAGSERDAFMSKDGSITKDGLNRIRNAMFEVAYKNSEALERLAEDPDDNVKNITSALVAVSGQFAKLRMLIEVGARHDVNIAPDVALAAAKFAHLRELGMPVAFYFDQQLPGLYSEDVALERGILEMMEKHKRSSVKIRNILQNYLDVVDTLGDPRTSSMFDEMKRPTKEEILETAIRYEEEGREPRLFEDTPPGGGALAESSAKYEAQTDSENFKKWFGNSAVVDSGGQPLQVYTGHRNVAVIGDRFRFAKATAGAFFFSESPEIGSNYALGKWGQQEQFEDGSQYIIYGPNGKALRIQDIQLTDEQKAIFTEWYQERYGKSLNEYINENMPYEAKWRRAKYNGMDSNLANWWQFMEWMGDNIAYARDAESPTEPMAFRQRKNDFEILMDKAGISWQNYQWDQPGVYPVYLSIQKPFSLEEAEKLWNNGDAQGVMQKLFSAGRREGPKELPDHEYKWSRDYPLKAWIDDLVEHIETGKETYWATQIPTKARRMLMEAGYDGIKDTGGKMGGPQHVVWLAFQEGQIKSSIGNKGTFDPRSTSIVREKDSSGYQAVLDMEPQMTQKISDGAEEVGLNLGEVRPVVKWIPVELVAVKGSKIRNALDVALISREVTAMDAQENYLFVVTAQNDNILGIFRYSRGLASSAPYDPAIVAGQILNVPGAANVWFTHNHPTGMADLSMGDRNATANMEVLLKNTPITVRDTVSVTDKRYHSMASSSNPVNFPSEGKLGEALNLPVLERRFAKRPVNPTHLPNVAAVWEFGIKKLPEGGIVLLNQQLEVVGTVRVPDLTKLSGEHHIKILQEAERRNATTLMAIYPNREITTSEYAFLKNFSNAADMKLVEVMDKRRSWASDGALGQWEETWFHPNTVMEEIKAFQAGAKDSPIDRYVAWLMQKKRIVPMHDGKSLEPPDSARPMISMQPPPDAPHDISIWTVGQSPHHVMGRVWNAKDSPVIDAQEAAMTFQQNITNDDRWAGAVLNHAGVTNEVKAITAAVKPLFEKHRVLITEYAKLEGQITTINAQLRKIPVHQAYDSLEKEVRRLERLMTKIDKHIGTLKTQKARDKWEATKRRTIKMIERRMEKLSALEIKYMRIRQINDLRARKANLKAQQVQLLPGFQQMERQFDQILVGLAQKYADVRVYLAAEDNLPPGIKLNQQEQEAANAIKKFMIKKRDLLESMMIPVITDKAYMTHLWRDLLEDDAVRIFAFSVRRTPAILAFISRLPNSRPWIPSAAAALKAYIPTVNFKLSYQPVLNRWRPVVDQTMETNLRNYLQSWITQNIYKTPVTIMEASVNALVSFEYVRLIGLSMSVGFKHLLKLANTWAVYGPTIAGPATARMGKVPVQYLSEKFGGKVGPELRAIRAFVTQRALVRALDEIPGLHRAMNRFKLLMGQPVVSVEYFDNGVSILAGIIKGLRRDLDYEAIHRGIWETILDANFRAGWDQPLWQKKWGMRALTMFQMTPFKLFEMKVKLIENAMRNKRDAFGTHYAAILARFILIIGAAEGIARVNNTSVLELFLHFPFVRDLFHATKRGFEFGHPTPAWPPTAQMLEDWKDKGFKEGIIGTHQDWGIITKEYKAQTGKFSKQKFAGPNQYRLGLPKLGYEEQRARWEEEKREKERARKPSAGPFNLRKAYQTTH